MYICVICTYSTTYCMHECINSKSCMQGATCITRVCVCVSVGLAMVGCPHARDGFPGDTGPWAEFGGTSDPPAVEFFDYDDLGIDDDDYG